MRKECPDCVIYRSVPNHKGDCKNCLLELDWEQVAMDLEKHNRGGMKRTLRRSNNIMNHIFRVRPQTVIEEEEE